MFQVVDGSNPKFPSPLRRYDYINTFETVLADICRTLPHLTSLTYARTGLESVPSDIARFTNLRMLDLRDQSIVGVAPEIGDSKTLQRTLQRLDISSNRLTTLPMSMGKLTALKILEIRRNHMTKLPPAVFELRGLEVLDAGNNRLDSLPPSFGDLLPNLKILRLKNSHPTLKIPASFKKLTHLKFLDLRVSLLMTHTRVHLRCLLLGLVESWCRLRPFALLFWMIYWVQPTIVVNYNCSV